MDRRLIEARLSALSEEFASGQKLLAEYDNRVAGLREQLLRISGAMRVLSELLERDTPAQGAAALAPAPPS
jgi:uncharacterized coiled-coil protein SlyX